VIEGSYHAPVLVDEVVSHLVTDAEGIYVDATLGGGGHTEAVCKALHGSGRVIAFDVDEDAIRFARARLKQYGTNVTIVRANFNELRMNLNHLGIDRIRGLLLDLGVSSFQLNEESRGFSFRTDAKIDMRMDQRQTFTGWDVVNSYDEKQVADLLKKFGEERNAKRIAERIVRARPLNSTQQLKDAVESAVGGRFLTKTLARVFQAIRIEVNQELRNLARVLSDSLDLLLPGGRIAVISYHSLEDRIVKNFFREYSAPSGTQDRSLPRFRLLTKKPLRASAGEIEQNPRARSAKLRVVERLDIPV